MIKMKKNVDVLETIKNKINKKNQLIPNIKNINLNQNLSERRKHKFFGKVLQIFPEVFLPLFVFIFLSNKFDTKLIMN